MSWKQCCTVSQLYMQHWMGIWRCWKTCHRLIYCGINKHAELLLRMVILSCWNRKGQINAHGMQGRAQMLQRMATLICWNGQGRIYQSLEWIYVLLGCLLVTLNRWIGPGRHLRYSWWSNGWAEVSYCTPPGSASWFWLNSVKGECDQWSTTRTCAPIWRSQSWICEQFLIQQTEQRIHSPSNVHCSMIILKQGLSRRTITISGEKDSEPTDPDP